MIVNLCLDILLVLFIIATAYILFQKRNWRFGLVVKKGEDHRSRWHAGAGDDLRTAKDK